MGNTRKKLISLCIYIWYYQYLSTKKSKNIYIRFIILNVLRMRSGRFRLIKPCTFWLSVSSEQKEREILKKWFIFLEILLILNDKYVTFIHTESEDTRPKRQSPLLQSLENAQVQFFSHILCNDSDFSSKLRYVARYFWNKYFIGTSGSIKHSWKRVWIR